MAKAIATSKELLSRPWLALVILTVLVLFLRFPSHDLPFSNDGGAQAYHARLIAQGEPLYSTHHTGHHLPGAFYTNALAFRLFGDRTWSSKVMTSLWVLGTVYVIYVLGKLIASQGVGFLAALFYGLLSSQVFLMGPSAEMELLANLPRTAAILVALQLALRHFESKSPTGLWWRLMLVGILSAMAFLFKANYVSSLLVMGCVLLGYLWQHRTLPGVWWRTIAFGLWVSLGFFLVLLAVILYFSWLGLWPRLMLVFTIAQDYLSLRNGNSQVGFVAYLFPVFALIRANALLLILSLMAVLLYIVSRKKRSIGLLYIIIWFVLSYAESMVTRVFFTHYYLLILPPLSLLAAWMLIKLYQDLSRWRPAGVPVAMGVLVAVTVFAFVISVGQDIDYYGSYFRYKLGQGPYEDFILSGSHITSADTLRTEKLAAYLQSRTTDQDSIYYWSGNTQLYYLVNRRNPLDMIWPVYADATGPYQRIFTPQTKYVILGESNNIPRPDWLQEEVTKAYTLETIIDEQEIYRRIE